ncbi:LIC11966 family surface protein [Flavisolibacter tropicus]|uniref:Lipoprotein n=1 Tax=Flavisolibacter tropicus TaxID=1492898 RepID=A0A172TYI4_9BACT|nr:hypothetical protein [Flavisolibacter tropicus]ANE51843.1 hypothetical protein SY85_16440 [Flavisolibacter tropicus]
MKTITAFLLALVALVSCSGINSLKYHDEIYNAHEDLLKHYDKLDKTFNDQTGKPEGAAVLQKEITSFSTHTDSLIGKVKGIEKLDDDFFKTAFVSFATEMKGIVNTDYKSLTALITVKHEDFTEAMETQEAATIEAIKKKLEALNDVFLKQQEVFAKRYDITLQ